MAGRVGENTSLQVVLAIGSIAQSMLARGNSMKSVVSGDESLCTSCFAQLLHAIDLEHAIADIINSCLAAHHTQYRSGTKTLMTMTSFLCQQLTHLIDQGVSRSDALLYARDALLLCEASLQLVAVSVGCAERPTRRDHSEVSQPEPHDLDDRLNDLDDIAWFFNDEHAPAAPTFPPDLSPSHRNVRAGCDRDVTEKGDYEGLTLGSSSGDGGRASSEHGRASEDTSDDSSDFDDCFENVTFVECSCELRTNGAVIGQSDVEDTRLGLVQNSVLSQAVLNGDTSVLCDTRRSVPHRLSGVPHLNSLTDRLIGGQSTRAVSGMSSGDATTPVAQSADAWYCKQPDVNFEDCVVRGAQFSNHLLQPMSERLEEKQPISERLEKKQPISVQLEKKQPIDIVGLRQLVTGICRESKLITDCLLKATVNQMAAVNQTTAVNQVETMLPDPTIKLSLCLSRLLTSSRVGPLCSAVEVMTGAVMTACVRHLSSLHSVDRVASGLLVNGDASCRFRHRGYLRNKECVATLDLTQFEARSDEACWLSDVTAVLRELQVTVVFVSGAADVTFVDLCESEDILVLTSVPYRVLQAIAEDTRTQTVLYINEATQENIAREILIHPRRFDWMDQHEKTCDIVVETGGSHIQSIIFIHPIESVASDSEERFWHCAHRLQRALAAGLVLPGGGETENYCIGKLRNAAAVFLADGAAASHIRSVIYEGCAAAFEDFVLTVRRNVDPSRDGSAGQSEQQQAACCGPVVYDDIGAKAASWRHAMDLTSIVLRTRRQLVNGIDDVFLKHNHNILCTF